MQHDEPGEPDGARTGCPPRRAHFRPMLRMYEPDAAVFDGTYELPPITRVG